MKGPSGNYGPVQEAFTTYGKGVSFVGQGPQKDYFPPNRTRAPSPGLAEFYFHCSAEPVSDPYTKRTVPSMPVLENPPREADIIPQLTTATPIRPPMVHPPLGDDLTGVSTWVTSLFPYPGTDTDYGIPLPAC
ncbi:hypothetical protein MKZ38_002657 [Zalerion maritima]|uniref:Uncharacterized protein n=1 Tax=Zalerion maritima TaxID=339359 RepID=A0AAD5RX76_9PEZI|nr:hypothetical protein MKZ38_002657 [Zalerion maritima]